MLAESVANADPSDESADRWPAAYLDFYRGHFDGLVRTSAAIVGRPDVAQEVVQESLLKVAKAWEQIESPYGYARRCVVNASRDHLRRVRRLRRLDRTGDETADPLPDQPPDIAPIERALRRLSPRRQTALALRFYDDLEYDEIAELMDCRPATARSLVHRGLNDLRRTT